MYDGDSTIEQWAETTSSVHGYPGSPRIAANSSTPSVQTPSDAHPTTKLACRRTQHQNRSLSDAGRRGQQTTALDLTTPTQRLELQQSGLLPSSPSTLDRPARLLHKPRSLPVARRDHDQALPVRPSARYTPRIASINPPTHL